MSNYENSPATALVATRCCCCGRKLVDADSVESGVGPVCRKKHGFAAPDVDPDFESAAVAADQLGDTGLDIAAVTAALNAQDAHKACNVLTYHAACHQGTETAQRIAAAVAVLGYRVLAAKIAGHAGAIAVVCVEDEKLGEAFAVKAPYSKVFNAVIYRSGAKQYWHKKTKTRRVAVADRAKLVFALREAFAGKSIAGPDGVKVLKSAKKAA